MKTGDRRGIRLGVALAGVASALALGAFAGAGPVQAASVWQFTGEAGAQDFTLGANSDQGFAGFAGRIGEGINLVGGQAGFDAEYLGKEAAFDSTLTVTGLGLAALEVFDSQIAALGDTMQAAVSGNGGLTFDFVVDGGRGVGAASSPSGNIWFATSDTDAQLADNVLIIGFEDMVLPADGDYDDFVVRLTANRPTDMVVPLPGAGILFATALAAIAAVSRRRGASA